MEVDRYFIKEKLDVNLISFRFFPTEKQLADILINGISHKAFYDSLNAWLMCIRQLEVEY